MIHKRTGHVRIRTAPLYRGDRANLTVGATDDDQRVVAGGDGRLAFDVDLGPAHELEQFSPLADALEAAGHSWVERTIDIQ